MDFATYTKDGTTGFEYAMNRYYSAAMGRFLTADPETSSGYPSEPLSWNRFSYTLDEPVNFFDPGGTDTCGPDWGDYSTGNCMSYEAEQTAPPAAPNAAPNPSSEIDDAEADYVAGLPWGSDLPPDRVIFFLPAATIGVGAGGAICVGSGVCEVVAGTIALGTAMWGAWQLGKWIGNVYYKNSDQIVLPTRTTSGRDASGNRIRPNQNKWTDIGDEHGGQFGYHWHWLTQNLADPSTCTWYAIRGGGPNDPVPDYILLTGSFTGVR